MEIIATDFYLFIVLYLGYYFFRRDLIENNIDEENMWTYIANESTTKEMLKDFYKSLINEEVDDETINSLYDILAKVIKDQRRIRLIREAESHQNTYEKLDIEELKNNIKERLINSIKETFESIYDESLENTATKSIDLEKINTTTEQIINTDILKGQYQLIHARLLFHIIQYLDKANLITKRERNKDFRDDVAYMRYLKENNISILMGDRNVLINQSYNMYAEFNKYLEHFKSQFLPFRNFGIGLEEGAVLFKVNSIDVSISSSSIKDEGIRHDEENNKYMYDSSGITIDFDENEIKKFVLWRKNIMGSPI